MGERVNHVRDDEDDLIEITAIPELAGSGCDRKPEDAVKAHSEVSGAVRPVRYLAHQQLMKLRVGRVSFDHGLDHSAGEIVQR